MQNTCIGRHAFALAFALAMSLSPASSEQRGEADPQEELPDFTVQEVAGPFEFPWSLAFLPDGRILITERAGRLQIVDPPTASKSEVSGLTPVLVRSHAGLLDVVLDPDFSDNQTLYLSYIHGTEDESTLRVLKAKLDLGHLILKDQMILFETTPSAPGLEQYGGRLAIGRDGYLYLSVGDRFQPDRAQDLADHAGSILRLARDGSVPPDNPFVEKPGALPEIWTYGHRNPQGLAFHPETGALWSHEHGPAGGDELNLIERGRNYGWPVITYGRNYDGTPVGIGTERDGLEQPRYHWTPSIAPSGLTIAGEAAPPKWRGKLWLGALAGQRLVRLTLDGDRVAREEQFLPGELGRIRDVRIAPNGNVYFVTDDPEGKLYEISPQRRTALLESLMRRAAQRGYRRVGQSRRESP